jgi:hypothetical protein
VTTYLTNECSFELDGDFADHTVHALEARIDEDAAVRVWLSRRRLPAGRSLRDALRAHMLVRSARLEGYRAVAEREGEVAGAPAIELSARFRKDGAVVHEREAHFSAEGDWYCVSAHAKIDDRAACDGVMERALATLCFRAKELDGSAIFDLTPPGLHCTNDIAFELPDLRWEDLTLHEIDAPTDDERSCTLIVHRTRVEPGDDFQSLADLLLRHAALAQARHAGAREIAGQPAIDVAVQRRSEGSMVYTRQAVLMAGGLFLGLGINGFLEDAAVCDAHLDRVLATLRLRA